MCDGWGCYVWFVTKQVITDLTIVYQNSYLFLFYWIITKKRFVKLYLTSLIITINSIFYCFVCIYYYTVVFVCFFSYTTFEVLQS